MELRQVSPASALELGVPIDRITPLAFLASGFLVAVFGFYIGTAFGAFVLEFHSAERNNIHAIISSELPAKPMRNASYGFTIPPRTARQSVLGLACRSPTLPDLPIAELYG